MKKYLLLIISCILCGIGYAQNNVIETELQEVLNQRSGEMIDVSIMFKSQMDAAELKAKAGRSNDKAIKREIVVSELKDFSSRTQSDVMDILKAEEVNGNVNDIEALWIVNAISCKANRDVIYKLASHPDIAALSYDKEIQLISDEQMAEVTEMEARRGPAAHVVTINADHVWEQGYTGKNVVVAVLDTGVNLNHEDIKDNLWEGAIDTNGDDNPDMNVNGWNTVFNNSNIIDDNGHGTHCAGIVCGNGTSGITTGVAPDAKLMTVKVAGAGGTGSVNNMLNGVQFALDNGADILSISLGYNNSQVSVAQKESIREAFNNVLASGAIACAAVGNDGNNYGAPFNVDYPAACPSPWRNPAQTLEGGLSSVIAVGANDLQSSSQGPSTWQDTEFNDYKYSKWTYYCAYTNSFDDYGGTHSSANSFKWAVKYTPNMLSGYTALSKVSAFAYSSTNVNIYVYKGGDSEPETLLHQENGIALSSGTWNEITLSETIEIDPTKNIWLVFEGQKAAFGRTINDNINSRYIFDGESWTGFVYESNGNTMNLMWLVRGYFEDIDGNTSEIGLIRPDITAPGKLVYSLNHTQNDAYKMMEGSSQSTPAVAGVIALMLEKNSSLTPAQIAEIIETTAADKPENGKNNVVGAGRVDALEAIEKTTEGEKVPYLQLASFSPENITTGDVEIKFTVKNEGKGTSSQSAVAIVSLNSDQYVSMTDKTFNIGELNYGSTKEFSFTINVDEQVPNGHISNFDLHIMDGEYVWQDNFSIKVDATPNIVYKSCSPGIIKPEDGEVSLNVTMVNNGTAASVNNTKVILSCLNHITIVNNEATIGALGVNETATATFTIKANDDAPDNYSTDLFLETFSESTTASNYIYEFENGLEGWTSFDAANNDIDEAWWHSSETFAHGKTYNGSHSGNGHLMSETMITTGMNVFYDNPIDNYLVSPNKIKITENSEISFYAGANHDSYYEEHFGLAISETSNESGFTTIKEWHITEGTKSWNKYTFDLSQYEGKEIYVAIRHFFTEEEWTALDGGYEVEALNIDDILLSNVMINQHHVPTYDDTDVNYFNVVISNPVDIDLEAPTGLTISNVAEESLTLTWVELENAQSYNIYRNGEMIANVTATTYNDNNLTHNTEYCYTVAGVHNGNVHEQCEAVCATTPQKDYSTAIKSFTPEIVSTNQNSITLDVTFINDGQFAHQSWSNITLSSEDEYVTIVTATAKWSPLPSAGEETTKTFTFTIDENTPHNHEILFNANVKYNNGDTSWDLPLLITVKNDPMAPKNVTATSTENSVTLQWNAVENVISYNIYRDNEAIGSTASTTYYDGGLNASTEYRYYVTSVSSEGESDRSKEVSVTTKAANEGIALQSFSMEAGLGQNITLTATLINNGSEATPEATTATLTCEDEYVTIVDGTYDLGSMASGATKDATFTIMLSESTPLNHVLNFNVTAEYENEGGGTANKSYTFDNDLEGWTTMTTDAHNWYHSTSQGDHGYSKNYNTGGFIFSESYCNVDYDGFDPNHWIVSPEKIVPSDATSFDFYVCSMSSSTVYADETFGIFVSTTSNTDPNAFTEISKWTLAKNSNSLKLALKSAGLYDYEGQEIWVAIRHYGAGNNAALAVDNITIYNLVQSSTISKTSSFSVVANPSLNIFAGTGSWSNASLWSKKSVPTSTEDIAINGNATIESGNIIAKTISISGGSLTINSGASLTVNETFVNSNAASLIINDGAQIFQNNENVAATFNMNMTNPSDWESTMNIDGWQFISSPVKNANTADFAPENDYDLFKYDGTQELQWVNYKGHSTTDFEATFQQGRGYLASYEEEMTATFSGILNHETSFVFSELKDYDEQDRFNNFYLLGNPFSFNMKWSNVTAENIYDGGFATVNSSGSYEYHGVSSSINVGDGFMILVTEGSPSLSYGAAKRGNAKSETINLIATGNEGKDNLIISLDGAEDRGFNKLDNFNKEIAEIYVANNGSRYAIMSYDENVTEIPVSFDAKQMGSYTINAIANGKFSSVILIDRFTGVETNLLLEGYTFTATSSDNHDRFIVKLVNSQQTTDNSHFAYVSGEDLILNIEGSVQIIDVMGRIVYANDVTSDNNRINVSNFDNAAYVIRVINENGVKVQKIIL